jgi:hypothetical protein
MSLIGLERIDALRHVAKAQGWGSSINPGLDERDAVGAPVPPQLAAATALPLDKIAMLAW